MGIPKDQRSAIIEGVQQADRARRELQLNSQHWIDPFAGILKTDALFMLQPLDSLFGAFLPKAGSRPGILVNSKHPLPLQRFTAAHELGHLWMGHGESFDTEQDIYRSKGGTSTPIEIAAETFASFFLMPRAMVEQRISDLRLGPRLRDPRGPYMLSLWFGVSYLAMVWQLVALKHITRSEAERLSNIAPKTIKAQLLDGDRLEDPWADVLQLDLDASSKTIVSRVGDELAITLPSHAPSGYVWETETLQNEPFKLTAERELVSEAPDDAIGVAHPRRVVVRLQEQGQHTLHLAERRPFSRQSPPAAEFTLRLLVVGKPKPGRVEHPLLPVDHSV